jgi:hypothetical protein
VLACNRQSGWRSRSHYRCHRHGIRKRGNRVGCSCLASGQTDKAGDERCLFVPLGGYKR